MIFKQETTMRTGTLISSAMAFTFTGGSTFNQSRSSGNMKAWVVAMVVVVSGCAGGGLSLADNAQPCAVDRQILRDCAREFGPSSVCAYEHEGARYCVTTKSDCAAPRMALAESVDSLTAGACVCVDDLCR